jgi:hypothetical protein
MGWTLAPHATYGVPGVAGNLLLLAANGLPSWFGKRDGWHVKTLEAFRRLHQA